MDLDLLLEPEGGARQSDGRKAGTFTGSGETGRSTESLAAVTLTYLCCLL